MHSCWSCVVYTGGGSQWELPNRALSTRSQSELMEDTGDTPRAAFHKQGLGGKKVVCIFGMCAVLVYTKRLSKCGTCIVNKHSSLK